MNNFSLSQISSLIKQLPPQFTQQGLMNGFPQTPLTSQAMAMSTPVLSPPPAPPKPVVFQQAANQDSPIINPAAIQTDASKMYTTMFDSFNKNIKNTTLLTDTYDNLLNNYVNNQELYKGYANSNSILTTNIQTIQSNISTDERISYYKYQNIDYLKKWYRVFSWIYAFYFLALVIILFYKNISIVKKILIFLFFCIFPFIITPVVILFVFLHKIIFDFFFSKAYTNNNSTSDSSLNIDFDSTKTIDTIKNTIV